MPFFDELEVGESVDADKTDGLSGRTGATRAANAVGVNDGGARQVVVDDDGQGYEVETTGGDIGGDKDLELTGVEIGEDLGASALAQCAVKGAGFEAEAAQLFGHVPGGVFGGHEDENPGPGMRFDELAQKLSAARCVDLEGGFGDGGGNGRSIGNYDTLGFLQQGLGEGGDLGREGGGEEQILTFRGE